MEDFDENMAQNRGSLNLVRYDNDRLSFQTLKTSNDEFNTSFDLGGVIQYQDEWDDPRKFFVVN